MSTQLCIVAYLQDALQRGIAELREEFRSLEGHRVARRMQEVSQDISTTLTHLRDMPDHFMNLSERVEAVWDLLQLPDTRIVALVGMGGIGRRDLSLQCCSFHGVSIALQAVFVEQLLEEFLFCIIVPSDHISAETAWDP